MKRLKIYKIIMDIALIGSLSGCSSKEIEEVDKVDNTNQTRTFATGEHMLVEDITIFKIKPREGYKPIGIVKSNHLGIDFFLFFGKI